jgi:VanZ family protein
MIESGQMFSRGRTASILDALCSGLGAAMGAAAGQLLFRAFRGSFGLLLLQLLRQHPAVVLLALLLLASAADAYYPFDVTLDVSTVWRNVKNARLIPFAGGLRRFWLDLFIEKILLFAAVGYLAYRSLAQNNFPASRRNVWAGCSIIALLIEGGKLFFAGRAPNIDNVLLSSLGALGGVLFIPPFGCHRICSSVRQADPNYIDTLRGRLCGAFALRLDLVDRRNPPTALKDRMASVRLLLPGGAASGAF